jgi:hypothetical protein
MAVAAAGANFGGPAAAAAAAAAASPSLNASRSSPLENSGAVLSLQVF